MKPSFAACSIVLVGSVFGYCPPTGSVLPPPNLYGHGNLTASLRQSVRQLINTTIPFNSSDTSFSVQVTSPDSTFFEFHHTAPVREIVGVDQVDGNTVYRVASVSKMVTTYALLLQNDVNLDDPVSKHVPALSGPGLEGYQNITLRMLAGQIGGTGREGAVFDTSLTLPPDVAVALGLPQPEFPPDAPICDIQDPSNCTDSEFFDILRYVGHPWKAGDRAAYSNMAFSLIAYALENITGLSYPEIIDKYISQPLDLASTGFGLPPKKDSIVPVVRGPSWVNISMGFYDPTAGMHSSPNDLSRIARSILRHSLLTEANRNAWLKPVAFTSSPYNAVGAPWEIYLPTNLAHSPRPTEIYTKAGGGPGYAAFFALVPEYGIGITVNSAGDDAIITSRYLMDLVVQHLVPRAEELARQQTEAQYAGRYAGSEGASLTLSVDEGPGLRISNWTNNDVSMIETWATIRGLDPAGVEVRAYPVGEGGRWQLVLDGKAQFSLFEPACEEWLNVASFRYAGLPVDEISFGVDAGVVTGLRVPGLRQELAKL